MGLYRQELPTVPYLTYLYSFTLAHLYVDIHLCRVFQSQAIAISRASRHLENVKSFRIIERHQLWVNRPFKHPMPSSILLTEHSCKLHHSQTLPLLH